MIKHAVIILLLVLGCSPRPKLSPREADYVALQLLATQLNLAQTNWTVIITNR